MKKVLIPLITLQLVLADSASVIGKVIDQDTHQPLSGTIITIEELENNTITLRDRDSMKQIRISIEELIIEINKKLKL